MRSRHFAVERLTALRITPAPNHSSTPNDAVKCAAPKRLGFETYCYDDIISRNEFLDRLESCWPAHGEKYLVPAAKRGGQPQKWLRCLP
jgi:hypothetical protein